MRNLRAAARLTCGPCWRRMVTVRESNALAGRRLGRESQRQVHDLTGVNAALVTVPVFKTGETSYSDVWWVRFPSAPAFYSFSLNVNCKSMFSSGTFSPRNSTCG